MKNDAVLNTFTLPQPYDQVRCYTLLPDERAIVGTHDGAYLFDIKTGLVERHMSDRGEELWGLAPSPDFRYVLTAGNDQVMRVWKIDKGELLVALFVADEEWIAWTPQGYYAASLAGESLMGWHINRGPESMADFYPASRFSQVALSARRHSPLAANGRPDASRRAGRSRAERTVAGHQRGRRAAGRSENHAAGREPRRAEGGEDHRARRRREATENQQLTDLRLVINGRPFGAPKPVAAAPDAGSERSSGNGMSICRRATTAWP